MSNPNFIMAIVRHGQSTGNIENKWEGVKSVSGLSQLGKEQAEITGEYLGNFAADAQKIYTSPLRRALETADIISRYQSAPIESVKELIEIDMGALEGKASQEVMEGFPQILSLWGPEVSTPLPEGESAESVAIRGSEVMRDIGRRHKFSDKVIVVSHQGAITLGLATLLNNKASFMNYQPSNCGVTFIEFDPEPDLILLDYTDHLTSKGIETSKWIPKG